MLNYKLYTKVYKWISQITQKDRLVSNCRSTLELIHYDVQKSIRYRTFFHCNSILWNQISNILFLMPRAISSRTLVQIDSVRPSYTLGKDQVCQQFYRFQMKIYSKDILKKLFIWFTLTIHLKSLLQSNIYLAGSYSLMVGRWRISRFELRIA